MYIVVDTNGAHEVSYEDTLSDVALQVNYLLQQGVLVEDIVVGEALRLNISHSIQIGKGTTEYEWVG